MTNRERERPPLTSGHRAIGAFHVLLAVAFVVVGFVDTGGGDGWSDLARLAIALIAGIYVLATATVTAVARYVLSGIGIRYGLLVVGPPALMAIAIVVIRGA